jgi:hypothetical protein
MPCDTTVAVLTGPTVTLVVVSVRGIRKQPCNQVQASCVWTGTYRAYCRGKAACRVAHAVVGSLVCY